MIDGFVTIYRDKERFIHLYFYPGYADDGTHIYNSIDLKNCGVRFAESKNTDGSSDFKFENKNIVKIHCKLMKQNGEFDIRNLSI